MTSLEGFEVIARGVKVTRLMTEFYMLSLHVTSRIKVAKCEVTNIGKLRNPKILLGTCWAIHNDPKQHPDHRRFDPTRYIHDQSTAVESANHPDLTKRDQFGFGTGCRVCEGNAFCKTVLVPGHIASPMGL
ncbi:hypothetical protein COCMIDRAFT_30993 [Bipolaris oryzae ATCC 44560]|uniref:Uncharacterized protein n=1 Tax=Bipolaris oryzae ATCC 44560 TaxID=930090 RepID=W6YQR8_COCMI|nr:uncharacterized protein COCMIDRAFT_30993 [Bipolaris oryzae ATCC 44560]EUC39985.1 hypothetical protein COCMIDRAFT_30993 [Bipolaris oryzae ATCC 44560]